MLVKQELLYIANPHMRDLIPPEINLLDPLQTQQLLRNKAEFLILDLTVLEAHYSEPFVELEGIYEWLEIHIGEEIG